MTGGQRHYKYRTERNQAREERDKALAANRSIAAGLERCQAKVARLEEEAERAAR